MRNKKGEKRIQAERPRVQGNPPGSLDRDPHGVILGYASRDYLYYNRLPGQSNLPPATDPCRVCGRITGRGRAVFY